MTRQMMEVVKTLYIINWHTLIYNELNKVLRHSSSVVSCHMKLEKFSIGFMHLSKYPTHVVCTVYCSTEFATLHQAMSLC